jgi:GT2 family glycosyltransferase
MDISVCIVNWNTKELLSNCIDSILEKTSDVSYEVIVVDNNSTDGSAEMVKRRFPNCKLIESKENLGFSRGNNLGLWEATGKYILFLNPDTILITNALLGMFQFMEVNTDVGAVGCKLRSQDGSIQFTCARTYPSLWNQFCDMMMLNRLFPRSKMFSTIEMVYWDHKDSSAVDCLSGACIFAMKGIVTELRGFDEGFFMYAEDVDLCYRIKREGWTLYYLASEEIFHLEGASSKKQSQEYFSTIAMRESNYHLFEKHRGKIPAQLYKTITFIGSIFRLIIIMASVFVLRNSRMKMSEKKTAFWKYFYLASWTVGLKKVVKPP